MSEPLITSDDLGTYLNDQTINGDRADLMIALAQTLCESIISPLPDSAVVVVMRVAARGYVTTTSARQAQTAVAGSPFGSVPGGMGGIYLTGTDESDLRRLAGSGGAFSIDLLPAGYIAPAPHWDYDGFGDWP